MASKLEGLPGRDRCFQPAGVIKMKTNTAETRAGLSCNQADRLQGGAVATLPQQSD